MCLRCFQNIVLKQYFINEIKDCLKKKQISIKVSALFNSGKSYSSTQFEFTRNRGIVYYYFQSNALCTIYAKKIKLNEC